jgi:hypothetical protein
MTFAITVNNDQRVLELFHDVNAPQGAVPISNEDGETLRRATRFADWVYQNNTLTFDPEGEPFGVTQARLTATIQAHIDATARQRNYDSALSCVSYLNSTIPTFAAEAAAMLTWRDQCWVTAVQVLGEIMAEIRPIPTEAEAIALLPTITWPS